MTRRTLEMKKLQILRVDNDSVEKADLQIGNNIIGRNVVTGGDDDRVIKHAVTINLSPDNEMTITPYQVSPCYMKSSESSRWRLLKLGTTIPIKPGDVCSMVPDKCWFKVVLAPGMMEESQELTSKRKANEDTDSTVPDKKPCFRSGEGDNTQCLSNVQNDILNNNNDVLKVKDEGKITDEENLENTICGASSERENNTHEPDSKLVREIPNADQSFISEQDVCNSGDTNTVGSKVLKGSKEDSQNTSQSDKPVTEDDQAGPEQVVEPTVSSDTPANISKREKCVYGEKCYRRNPQHKAKFSHPGDSDYDVPDNREECPYGVRCYRKNPQHKTQFKHTGTNQRRNRRRKQVPDQTTKQADDLWDTGDSSAEDSFEESVDESDYEPSTYEETDEDEIYSDKDGSVWEEEEDDTDE